MIKLTLKIDSQILYRPVDVHIALPYAILTPLIPYKSIWALHCAMNSGDIFFNSLNLSSYVDKNNVAIIAPDLGNAYFINSPYEKQFDFLHKELMPLLMHSLPLPKKQDDTMLLGISMGAFGASHWALAQKETFSKIALISGIYDFSFPPDERAKKHREQRPLVKLFGEKLMPLFVADKEGNVLPEADIAPLYVNASNCKTMEFKLYCGEEDYISLLESKNFVEKCQEHNINADLELFCGGHNVKFWQEAVRKSMSWLLGAE